MKVKPILIVSLVSISLLGVSCAPARNFDSYLSSIVKPYRFSLVSWELKALLTDLRVSILDKGDKGEDNPDVVKEYFSLVAQIEVLKQQIESIKSGNRPGNLALLEREQDELNRRKADLEGRVERTISRQIVGTLAQLDIYNPIRENLKVSFPPLKFKLEKPPHLLVISPRSRIETVREVLLKPELSLEEKAAIEAEVDRLDVSSLVVALGGLGTYPSLVVDDATLRFTLNAVVEEWLHQYLLFKPLGFLYLLDLSGLVPNYEIATMNETLASMVSKEIGTILDQKYYAQDEGEASDQAGKGESGFNQEMREIRRMVDEYLVRGEVEQAEEFMEKKRQYLASKGYYLRKLNQAYFAFYGTYADSPISISPIGVELRELWSQSASLKEFLNTVGAMSSRQELKEALASGVCPRVAPP